MLRRIIFVASLFAASGTPARAAGDAPVGHYTSRSEHFVLHSDCDEQVRAHLIRRFESFHEALGVMVPAATGVEPARQRIGVIVFCSQAPYLSWARRHAPGRVDNGGYYDGARRTVVTYWRSNPLQVILHEIAHAAMGDVFRDPGYARYRRPRWPVWFDEGMAEHLSSFEPSDGALTFGAIHRARLATLVDSLDNHQWIPAAALLKTPSRSFSGASMEAWYAAAWGLVHLLLSDPELRLAVPAWVQRLRRGEDGSASFLEVFGGAGGQLDRRLIAHIAALGARPSRAATLLSGDHIDAWTVHEGGSWSVKGTTCEGHSRGSKDYLTRPVGPSDALTVDMQVRRDSGTVGVVLGYHRAGGYPYHTLLALGPGAVTVYRTDAPNRITRLSRKSHASPAGQWLPLRLRVADGALTAWLDGRPVASSRLPFRNVSLFGVYLQGGAGGFRDLRLRGAPAAGSTMR